MQAITAIAQAVTNPANSSAFLSSPLSQAIGNTNIDATGAGASAAPQSPFSGLLMGAVQSMHRLDRQAALTTQGLIEGTGVDIHQATIATEKADMAFELALAVRNKAVSAYQQVMSMQF